MMCNVRRRSMSLIRKAFRGVSAIALAATAVLWTIPAYAMVPPTKAEIEQYKKDGTFAARQETARKLGNGQVSPTLVRRAEVRLQNAGAGSQNPPATASRVQDGIPSTGTLKAFALLIAFSDTPPVNSASYMAARLSGIGTPAEFPYESLRNYYLRSSYNQLDIQVDVLGWYTAPYPRSRVAQNDAGRTALIREAITYYANQGWDFSQYDNDGDNRIDDMMVFWSGPDTGWGSFWWDYTGYGSFGWSPLLGGKTLYWYSWGWESKPVGHAFTPNNAIHETGHILGLPDYYTTGPSGEYVSGAGGDCVAEK
jgi:hypothetical protein